MKKDVTHIRVTCQPEFGQRIRRMAEHAGGVSELARRAGVPYSTLANYISPGTDPSAAAALALANAGAVSLEWLLTGRSDAKEPGLALSEIERAIRETFEIIDFYEMDDLSREGLIASFGDVCREALAEGWYRQAAPFRKGEIKERIYEIVRRHAA